MGIKAFFTQPVDISWETIAAQIYYFILLYISVSLCEKLNWNGIGWIVTYFVLVYLSVRLFHRLRALKEKSDDKKQKAARTVRQLGADISRTCLSENDIAKLTHSSGKTPRAELEDFRRRDS